MEPQAILQTPITIDLVSNKESECGYNGGVNHNIALCDILDSDSDADFTDEDLSEFNIEMLKDLEKDSESASCAELTPFKKLQIPKIRNEWLKSEKN